MNLQSRYGLDRAEDTLGGRLEHEIMSRTA
jgi:hypothetical protein